MGDFSFKKILGLFLAWRLGLFIILLLAIPVIPLQQNFLGGGLTNYLKLPYFWAWANFDGEHYLSIARWGYGQGEYPFFPLYPLLIKLFTGLFGSELINFGLSGLLISNPSFLIGLWGFYKLARLDYSPQIFRKSLFLIFLFPMSLYFAGVYSESLFFALIIWAFYFARKGKWAWSAVLALLSSATRFIGIVLLPALLIEFLQTRGKIEFKPLKIFFLGIIPLGLLAYMFYLQRTTGDPLSFFHTLTWFGEQRSATPVVLPQVFYRYIFKILPNLNYTYFPVVFATFLEIFTAFLFSLLTILGFFRLRASYAIYLFLGFLIPTLSGSFSSLPRYVIVLFPAYILLAREFEKLARVPRALTIFVLIVLSFVAVSLFVRGYWVS